MSDACKSQKEIVDVNYKQTESPYFVRKQRLQRISQSISKKKSSPFFLQSSSSAVGSIISLGNFVTCLSDCDTLSKTNCCRSSTSQLKVGEFWCHVCIPIVREATSHFLDCPTFSKQFDKIKAQKQHPTSKRNQNQLIQSNNCSTPRLSEFETDLECREELERIIDECVRHLCKNKCYLRAFAPVRDWRLLRDEVSKMTGKSPDQHLKRWKCRLARRSSEENEISQPLVQTVYVSPEGFLLESKFQVFRHLNLLQNVKKRKLDCLSTLLNDKRRIDDERGKIKNSADIPTRCEKDSWARNPLVLSRKIPCITASCWQYQQFPSSPFGLLEELFSNDPWCLLISTIMLNRTSRVQVDAILFEFFCKWPDPHSASLANPDEMSTLIQPLGIRHRRARGIIRFSEEYIELIAAKTKQSSDEEKHKRLQQQSLMQNARFIHQEEFELTREEIMGLFNCGAYASDAYEIFIQHRLSDVVPTDHALQYFVDYHQGLRNAKTMESK